MEQSKCPHKVEQSLQRINGLVSGLLSDDYKTGYKEGVDIMHEEFAALQARCERYEKALEAAQIALETCYDVINFPANGETRQDAAIVTINEALSGEGGKEADNGG